MFRKSLLPYDVASTQRVQSAKSWRVQRSAREIAPSKCLASIAAGEYGNQKGVITYRATNPKCFPMFPRRNLKSAYRLAIARSEMEIHGI